MELKTKICETVEKMPVSLQAELLHYAEYLQEKYHQENLTQDNSSVKSRIGILKGTFALPLADDFDESLEDFVHGMKGLLLDTHAFIWLSEDDPNLPQKARFYII